MTLGRVWRWHDEPALIAWVATPAGKLAVWLVALLLVPGWARIPVALALAPAIVWPERRIDVLALAALGVLLARIRSPLDPVGLAMRAVTALVMLGILVLAFQAARRFRDMPALVRRFPIATVHVVLLGTMATMIIGRHVLGIENDSAAAILPLGLELVIPFLLWRVSYLMLAGRRGTAAKDRFRDHLFYLLPLWGGTATPYGKGHAYLMQKKVEAPADLAATRLAGVKLLVLAWAWEGVVLALNAGVHGDAGTGLDWLAANALGVPTLGAAMAADATSHTLPLRWGAVLSSLVGKVLDFAIYGHAVIGVLRLFGFRVFRNTYKPLLSPSVVEFWNRYFYYFKELMVEFFFYPTYVATAGYGQRVRIFLAIMAAAGLGNLYYHLIRDPMEFLDGGPQRTASLIMGRATYSIVLALGIFVSMLREQARRGRKAPAGSVGRLRRLRAIAGVWIFFGLLHVWSIGMTRFGFGERLRFTLSLFGVTATEPGHG